MPVKCRERISRGLDQNKEPIYPTVSHLCELPAGHEGPHSSPSDMTSVEARKAWEAKEREREAERRHQESGLARTQSRPLPSSSITQPGTQLPHPGQATDCPFCDEKPLVKNFVGHVQEHAREQADEEYARRQEAHRAVTGAIPQPPAEFKVIRDPHAVEEPVNSPYQDGDESPEAGPDPEVQEAMDYLTDWFNSESRPRMARAAFEIVRDRLK